MASFSALFNEALSTHDLLPPGRSCVVAVSGGRDSMLLLRLLAERSRCPSIEGTATRFAVAHFHHQLRGAEADADRDLVVATAGSLGYPCHVGTDDVRAAAMRGESIEMAARRLRHAFLARVARETGADRIATGHHAGDQTELFLLRLLRGAGGRAFAGMGYQNPSPADHRLTLIRPLLGFAPAQLAIVARDLQLVWREDSSNRDTDPLRNRLRHDLIPRLESDYQPGLARVLARHASLLGDQADAIDQLARRWLASERLEPLESLAPAIARAALLRQLEALGVPPGFELVEMLRLQPDVPVQFDPSRTIHRNQRGDLEVRPKSTCPTGFLFAELGLDLGIDGSASPVRFGAREFSWSVLDEGWSTEPPASGHAIARSSESFDADAVGRFIRLRHWRPGDRFEPIGLGRPARLQDLFTNARVPADERRRRVLAETGDGRIFWVEGLRIGEAAKRRPGTKRRLAWRWRLVPDLDEALSGIASLSTTSAAALRSPDPGPPAAEVR